MENIKFYAENGKFDDLVSVGLEVEVMLSLYRSIVDGN